MATLQECERAVQGLVDRLGEVDPGLRSKHVPERTVLCRVPDLRVRFRGRLADGDVAELACEDDNGDRPDAQVRLTTGSDDLVALAEGRLAVPTAWATGRLKIEASVLDLLRLRNLL